MSHTWIFCGIVIFFVVSCHDLIFPEDEDEPGITDTRRPVIMSSLYDKDGYGFDIIYMTNDKVSDSGYNKICNRPSVVALENFIDNDSVNLHFKYGYKNVDIYDVATYLESLRRDNDYCLYEIKANATLGALYIGPNPDIPDYAKTFSPTCLQGAVYLSEYEIRDRHKKVRMYSYWGCRGNSYKDERFSHFSESEVIKE